MRNFWSQTHWLIGITAGVVLAVVGVTGGMLSFEHELLRLSNPGVMTVTPRAERLLPVEVLAERMRAAQPDKRLVSVSLSVEPDEAARAGFTPRPAERAGDKDKAPTPEARPRTEFLYFDPYTGESLGKAAGQEFFRTVTQFHRYLVAGDVGKHIVGASTIGLLIMSFSGLYLRWPRRIADWRAWFTVDLSRKGRRFLWHLHAVTGTWVLLFYLLTGFTGLYWSYEWYRNGLFALSGSTPPAREAATLDEPARGAPDIARVWEAFERESGGYRSVTLNFPQKLDQAVDIRYLDVDPAHNRATSRMMLHPASGAMIRHDRYSDRALGARLMSSMLSLHSGSYFGLIGTILVMLASLFMPVFAVTGWQMYLARRAKQGAARNAATKTPIADSVAKM
ncbi:MAG TPA: PepSY-associated TM helix domain-containing protein [Burkholderiales bacterium]|nr:PepSY-associated TM helix domain-containing protein [Burkholderiales bacterium]